MKPDRYEVAHYFRVNSYSKDVENMYKILINKIVRLVNSYDIDLSKQFVFSDYPTIEIQVNRLMKEFSNKIIKRIQFADYTEWNKANEKFDALVKNLFPDAPESKLAKYNDRAYAALDTFQNRVESGMNLSQRIWKNTTQAKTELETALAEGIKVGRNAHALAKSILNSLKEPNKYSWTKNYNPGTGIYKSSLKNALRVTRTETNMAYRKADSERIQNLDFVAGIEVFLSGSHPKIDICDRLKGTYPKKFVFIGWHPHCFCHSRTKLASDDEIRELNRMIMNDEDTSMFVPKNAIKEPNSEYKSWINENRDKLQVAQQNDKLPYFVKYNLDTFS